MQSDFGFLALGGKRRLASALHSEEKATEKYDTKLGLKAQSLAMCLRLPVRFRIRSRMHSSSSVPV